MSFVHLHCHSSYSLKEGTARPGELVARARAFGMPALALTDHNNMYGAVKFYLEARKAGVKPIIGLEVSLDDGSRLVLLARNMDGYRNLCHLASALQLQVQAESFDPAGFDDGEEVLPWDEPVRAAQLFGSPPNGHQTHAPLPRRARQAALPRGVLLSGRHNRGLVALSGGHQGRVNSLVMQGKVDRAAREAGMLLSAFGEGNFFIELTAHDDATTAALPALAGLARHLDIPVVAANDVLYLEPQHASLAWALAGGLRNASGSGGLLPGDEGAEQRGGGEKEGMGGQRCFKSPDEMGGLFREYPQALANTRFIAEQCTLELPLNKAHFPAVSFKSGETAFSKLWKLSFAGATRRYRPLTSDVISRLKQELDVIETLDFSSYFLIVRDIARFALSRDIPIMARGSVSNSLVAYLLGITQVDPLASGLLFERFLNLSRAKFEMPDIDLDLCWRRRDEVLNYVYEKYGRKHVANLGAHITFRLRSAWREMAKVFLVDPERVSYIARKLPHLLTDAEAGDSPDGAPPPGDLLDPGDGSFAISDTSQAIEKEAKAPSLKNERESLAFRCARAIEGLPRHAGMHSAAIAILPHPVADLVPLQRAARDPNMAITQYDKDDIESLGLVKMDLLGSRALTTLVDALQSSGLARGRGDTAHALQAIPENDERTYAMLARGDTLGCFQLESPGMRGLLKWLRPRSLPDIAIAISLFRPGPLEGGFMETFMRRRLGQEPVTYHHPAMEPVLSETSGVILFQEQFLKLANGLAGLDMGEAEKLRKELGKAKSADERARLGAAFVAGAIERGIPQLQAERVWEVIAAYSGFGFCKAHACSYALAAYRSAYMKAHYPHHFLAAQINNMGGYYGTTVYVEDARRLGVELLPPDVNHSGAWCEAPHKRRAIRLGLQFVKGLAAKTIDALVAERRANGPYRSLPDLLARVRMGPNEQAALVKAGACDALGPDVDADLDADLDVGAVAGKDAPAREENASVSSVAHLFGEQRLNRKQLMWLLPVLQQAARPMWGRKSPEVRALRHVAAMQLAAGDFLYSLSAPRVLGSRLLKLSVPPLEEYTPAELLALEREALGFTLTANEAALYQRDYERLGAVPAPELPGHAGRKAAVGGVIVAARRHITKQGDWMLFFTLQTTAGLVEAVLFPSAYKHHARLLADYGSGPYLVSGLVQVSGKGRGVAVQPPAELPLARDLALKMHPVVIVQEVQPLARQVTNSE